MAETREEVLARNAQRFAKAYYDNAAMKGAPMVPPERQAFEKGEDAYVDWMTKAMYAKMAADQNYTEENWNDAKADRLDAFKDVAGAEYAIGGGAGPEDVHYFNGWEKFKPLVENGVWYNMGPAAMTLKMSTMGYDPSNEQSKKQFWDDLTRYDRDYNRAKIVSDNLSTIGGKLSTVVAPTLAQESIRQSLTGDYDDDRARSAAAVDIVASGLLGGAAKAPYAWMAAAGAGGVEAGRQFANTMFGNEANWGAPAMAGMAAGTVPAGASYIGGILSKGSDVGARPLARGFARGLRGFDDPLVAERNMLKETLVKAREASKRGFEKAGSGTPQKSYIDIATAEGAGDYQRGLNMMKSLGFESRAEKNALEEAVYRAERNVADAQRAEDAVFSMPKQGQSIAERDLLRSKAVEVTAQAQKELENARIDLANYNSDRIINQPFYIGTKGRTYAEDLIGEAPDKPYNFTYAEPAMDIGDFARYAYERPTRFTPRTADGIIGQNAYEQTAKARDMLRTNLPEKYSKELGQGASKSKYDIGLVLGRAASDVFAPAETAWQVTPADIGSGFNAKVTAFKQSEWYKALENSTDPVAIEKKKAIDAAMKNMGAKE